MRPFEIVKRFGLKNPIFQVTASYGHFGRDAYEKEVKLSSGSEKVTFFAWEKLDMVEEIKSAFNI